VYYSEGTLVIRSLDGAEEILANCANPFLANFMAYQLNQRAR
jgi:hypothetical protein